MTTNTSRTTSPAVTDDTVTDPTILDRYGLQGLNGALPPRGRAALLVVDLQRGFTDPTCGPGFAMPQVVEAARQLVEGAHAAGVPVYFTTIAFGDGEQNVWLEKMPAMLDLVEGSGWDDIDPGLGLADGDVVVTKKAASAFSGTDLAEQLQQAGVETVVLCGATTSGCVRASVVDAISLGLRPFVVTDAVGDREEAPHRASLLDIQAKYGELVTKDEALALLEGVRTR